MGGGGSKTTTQSTSSNSPAVTALTNKLATGLSGQIDKGTSVFNQPLYTGLSGTTQAGVNALNSQAQAGQGALNNAFNWTNGVVNSGGYNDALSQAQSGYQGQIASGGYNGALTDAQNGIRGYLAESQADAPGYAGLRSGVIDDTLAATNGAFNASGRFAGGANIDSANKGIASAVGALDYQNYGDRLNRMLTGNQALAGIGQTAYGNMQNATSGLAGVGQTAMGNAAGAASALPGMFSATLAPAQAQLAAGSILDADALAKRQAEAQLYEQQQNAGWDTYAKASSILNGTAQAAGQTTSTKTPTAPLWQQLLGTGISAAGAFL